MSADMEHVINVCRRKAKSMIIGTSECDREDLAQEGILRAVTVASEPEVTTAWAIRCAINRMFDVSKVQHRRHHLSVNFHTLAYANSDRFLEAYEDDHSEVAQALKVETPTAWLEFESMPLSDEERRTILAHYFSEDQKDASRLLGISLAAYKGRLYRAQKRARQLAGVCQ